MGKILTDPQPIEIHGLNRRVVHIRWRDGAESVYRAAELRAVCPCASCYDPRGDGKGPVVTPAVVAVSMAPVGRYALQISWSDGHTSGIYPFRFLHDDCAGRLPSDPKLLVEEAAEAPAEDDAVPAARRVTPDTTMARVLELYPSAQRALFQRFHIGGCNSCGFEPSDTLAEVCRKRNVPDVAQVIALIYAAGSYDERLLLGVDQLRAWRAAGEPHTLFDVRRPDEIAQGAIEGAEPLTEERKSQLKESGDKAARLVFYCASGVRSLDVAAWFAGHGFSGAKSLDGGYRAWRASTQGAHHHAE